MCICAIQSSTQQQIQRIRRTPRWPLSICCQTRVAGQMDSSSFHRLCHMCDTSATRTTLATLFVHHDDRATSNKRTLVLAAISSWHGMHRLWQLLRYPFIVATVIRLAKTSHNIHNTRRLWTSSRLNVFRVAKYLTWIHRDELSQSASQPEWLCGTTEKKNSK